MRTAFAHPAVHGIVLWTFWDKHAWKKNTPLFHGHEFTVGSALNYLSTIIVNSNIIALPYVGC